MRLRAPGLLRPDRQAARILSWWEALPQVWTDRVFVPWVKTTGSTNADDVCLRRRFAFLQHEPNWQLYQFDPMPVCVRTAITTITTTTTGVEIQL